MKYEKFEEWMIGKKVTHMVTFSPGVIVERPAEDDPYITVRVKYDEGSLAGDTLGVFLRFLDFSEEKPSEEVGAQENSQINWEEGQIVWDIVYGKGVVSRVEEGGIFPIKVEFDDGGYEQYTLQGSEGNGTRTLFFSEPVITAELFPPKKPFVPTLKAGQMVVIKGNNCFENGCLRYVHLEQEDRIYTSEDSYFLKKDIATIYCVGEEIKFQ